VSCREFAGHHSAVAEVPRSSGDQVSHSIWSAITASRPPARERIGIVREFFVVLDSARRKWRRPMSAKVQRRRMIKAHNHRMPGRALRERCGNTGAS
jgi:hypothetical protein